MAVVDNTNYLSSLITAGADALTNLYYIKFTSPLSSTHADFMTSLTIRSSDFKAPVATQPTHRVDFMTTSADIPSPGIDIDKTISFKFRLDENYDVYKFLKYWQSATMNPSIDYAANTIFAEQSSTSTLFKVDVYGLQAPVTSLSQTNNLEDTKLFKTAKLLYSFEDCWVQSIKGLDYSYDSPDQIDITAVIKFFKYSGQLASYNGT